ncbi:hypothetical protein ACS0TY_002645 [Phlomoides rotata]
MVEPQPPSTNSAAFTYPPSLDHILSSISLLRTNIWVGFDIPIKTPKSRGISGRARCRAPRRLSSAPGGGDGWIFGMGIDTGESRSSLEDELPDEAIQLYPDACTVVEEDGKEQMAFDLYRAATTIYVKLEK